MEYSGIVSAVEIALTFHLFITCFEKTQRRFLHRNVFLSILLTCIRYRVPVLGDAGGVGSERRVHERGKILEFRAEIAPNIISSQFLSGRLIRLMTRINPKYIGNWIPGIV